MSLYTKNIQALATEMLKMHNKTSPEIMRGVFLVKEEGNYNLRIQADFVIP